tara:strand:- start:1136 stop:1345 length:210 start_codon:yes stop_codon:yes gene_type:complete
MNKALKGYSKNRFYSSIKNSYFRNKWPESCHSFISPTIGTGDLISNYVWDEKAFEKAIEQVRRLRGIAA